MVKMSASGIAAGIGVVLIAAVCVRLGFWQLHRLDERRAENAVLSAALAAPQIDLRGAILDSVLADPGRYRFRRARVEGNYDSAATFLLRGRARRGAPGVHLVAPLKLAGEGGTILVNRGWLPSPDAATADPRPYASTGSTVVEGILHPLGAAAGDPSPVMLRVDGTVVPSYQRLDWATFRSALAGDLLPVYLQRITPEGTPETLPATDPIPSTDNGPHLGYAFQWFSFAAIAVIGFGVVVTRKRRHH